MTNCSLLRGNTAASNGGAVYVEGASFSVRNCSFESNRAPRGAGLAAFARAGSFLTGEVSQSRFSGGRATDGGGVYLSPYLGAGASLSLAATEFVGNGAERSGGGAAAEAGAALAVSSGSLFVRNSAAAFGGAFATVSTKWAATSAAAAPVSVSVSAVHLTDTLLESNTAGISGGAAWVNGTDGWSVALLRTTFRTNAAAGATPRGGALSLESVGAAAVDLCRFENNSVVAAAPRAELWGSWVSSPFGQGSGGAIFAAAAATTASTLRLTDTVFSGNSADSGGALASVQGVRTDIRNCTLSGNEARYDGGGLLLDSRGVGAATEVHGEGTVFSGNVASRGGVVAVLAGHSCSLDGAAITGEAANADERSTEQPVALDCACGCLSLV